MASKPFHLVERAAERLRQEGLLDGMPLGSPPLATPPLPGVLLPERPELAGAAAGAAVADAARAEPRPARTVIEAALLERAGMVPWSRARSRVSEEIRLLQSQLLRSAFAPADGRQTPLNLVMVTSARPGEGKSFAALNIGGGIARQQDREVLLVDADGKPDSLGQKLGLAGAPGLLDLITDPGLDVADLVVPTALPKLSVLPVGRPLEQSAELFATRQMASIIGGLGRRYADRIVILDAPPCLSSSDPSTLAPLVGQIVFVVQAEHTQREEVESALDLVQTCPTIMLLLNKVQMNTTHSFGAYASPYA
jgi:receptor protein-tyrosine kinase